jgi:hypothetical protein
MRTALNHQLGLLDNLMSAVPANDFLEKLAPSQDWRPTEVALLARVNQPLTQQGLP